MKNYIAIVLALCLMLTLSSCGGASAPAAAAPTETASAPAETETEPTVETTASEEVTAPQDTLPPFNQEGTIAETVLLDQDGIRITAEELTYDNYSAELHLLLENTGTKTLTVLAETLGYSRNSVNGCMIQDGYMNCELAPGKKARDTVAFAYRDLMISGIREIADLEIGFYIADDDNNYTYPGPVSLKTSLADTHDYSQDDFGESIQSRASQNTFRYEVLHFSEEPLYDLQGIRTLSSGVLSNKDGEPLVFLELENTTEVPVEIVLSDIVINDLSVYSYRADSEFITPGKRTILSIPLPDEFYEHQRELFGITQLGSVGCTLTQRDEENEDIAAPVAVTVEIAGAEKPLDCSGTEIYNQNGLRILSKGILRDSSEYSKDFHILLMAENKTGDTVRLEDVYDSLSVNGFMADYSLSDIEMTDGQYGLIDIEVRESFLEENKITAPEEITEAELSLEISSGETTLDTPTVKITY